MESPKPTSDAGQSDLMLDPNAWRKVDFVTWHADSIPTADAASAAVATFVHSVVATPNWRESVAAAVPKLHAEAVTALQWQANAMVSRAEEAARQMTARADALKAQGDALVSQLARAQAPPAAAADPASYRAAIKAVDAGSGIGLGGLIVRVADPHDAQRTLTQGVTDADGIVILTLRDGIADLAREKLPLVFEVQTPRGASVTKGDLGSVPALGQTVTKIVTLGGSPALEPHALAGQRRRAALQIHITALNAMVNRLSTDGTALLARARQRSASIITTTAQ